MPAFLCVCAQNGCTVTFRLDEGAAAASLLAQLPLHIEVDDFCASEKIFYPPRPLTLNGTQLAAGRAGELAYYAPWGNVVMLYGPAHPCSALYALGSVVHGAGQIKNLCGMLTITQEKLEGDGCIS